MTNIVWLRQELRIEDNPALYSAAREKAPVLPVYLWQPDSDASAMPGGASKWWLHYSLTALEKALAALGAPLLIRAGAPETELPKLAAAYNADAVFWSRAYDPIGGAQDDRLAETLQRAGVACRIFAAATHLINPDTVMNGAGTPYKVFTPFWKTASAIPAIKPLPAPTRLVPPRKKPAGVTVKALKLLPEHDWAAGLRDAWTPGEEGATAQLERFVDSALATYEEARDYPAQQGVSRLSPHLRFGEISPRVITAVIDSACTERRDPQLTHNAGVYLRQLFWREFGVYLLRHFPAMTHAPMRPEFARFPWRNDDDALKQWQRGLTGYPIVDAGMRELWRTGWMHNRVRMIAASFLVKHLLLPWQSGAAWFWDTLVDADIANNTLGWQWVGGCGPDAAPYFRIFNPIKQGERYDATGAYVRQWVPELAPLDDKHIHTPWLASKTALNEANIVLGETYPLPLVDHQEARKRALDAYAFVRQG